MIPHPALVRLAEDAARAGNLPLQRCAHAGALTDLSYIQFVGSEGVACLAVGCPLRYWHSAQMVVDTADLDGFSTLLDFMLVALTPDAQPTTHTLGIDIGTFKTMSVLAVGAGLIMAVASRPHKMLVPGPGWAEHGANMDWWGDFVHVTGVLLAQSGIDPKTVRAVAANAIGPCMRAVDAASAPFMDGPLYGVDARATARIAALNAAIGEDDFLEACGFRLAACGSRLAACGNALASQSIEPKILWLKEIRPDLFARSAKGLTATSYLTWKLTGEYAIDHYMSANFTPQYDVHTLAWRQNLPISCHRTGCGACCGVPISPITAPP